MNTANGIFWQLLLIFSIIFLGFGIRDDSMLHIGLGMLLNTIWAIWTWGKLEAKGGKNA